MKKKKIINFLVLLIFTLIITGCDSESGYEVSNCIKCGDTYFPENVAVLSANIINLIKILVPILIIILGLIDLFKGIISGDDKKLDESKGSLIRKFIAGITIFLVVAIVQFAFGLLDTASDNGNDSLKCLKYFIVKDAASDVGEACPDRIEGSSSQNGTDTEYKMKENNDSDGESAAEQYRNSTTQEERQAQREATNVTNPDQCRAEDGNRWVYDGATPYCKHDRDSYVKQCADKPVSTCTSVDYCTVRYNGSERQCVFKY